MAEWFGKRLKLRGVVGLVKDQVAVGRAIAKRRFTATRIAALRATSHKEALPDEKYIRKILDGGSASRMRVSFCINVLMERLNKTQNWVVALKCLILFHRGLREGDFMFQDQMSYFPARGGRNYLNLSSFRDETSPFTWEVSYWIRWYAKFLDQWLLTCRILGFFLDTKAKSSKLSSEIVSSLGTYELVRGILTLQDLLHEVCAVQAEVSLIENLLVKEAFRMVLLDSFKVQEELRVRIIEVLQRHSNLQRSEASQLLQACEKLFTQSTRLLHLMEAAQQLNVVDTLECPEKILFTDHEIMKITEVLAAVSIQNVPVPLSLLNAHRELIPLSRQITSPNLKFDTTFPKADNGRNWSCSYLPKR